MSPYDIAIVFFVIVICFIIGMLVIDVLHYFSRKNRKKRGDRRK